MFQVTIVAVGLVVVVVVVVVRLFNYYSVYYSVKCSFIYVVVASSSSVVEDKDGRRCVTLMKRCARPRAPLTLYHATGWTKRRCIE